MNAPRDDRAAYMAAMMRNDFRACCEIEQRHGLYGYPPELVSVGLKAAAEGKDAEAAVEAYIEGSE